VKLSIHKLAARIGQEFKKLRADVRRDMDILRSSITTSASSTIPPHIHPKSDVIGLELKISQLDAKDSALTTAIAGKASTGAVGASGLTMATARLLGRSTALTGAVEEISVGTGLALSGGVLTASGSFAPSSNLATAIASISPGNNLAIPVGATLLDFSSTGAITGFSSTGQPDGKVIAIYVRSGILTIANESASSTASNRIITGQSDIVAHAGSMITLCLVRNGAGVLRWAVLGTSTPPIFTSSSDIERSASSLYVDTVVRGASFDFSFKNLQTVTGISADLTTGLTVNADTSVLMLGCSGAIRSIHGFVSGNAEGRVLIVRCNISQPFGFTLVHNSGTVASINNKIFSSTGADVTVNPGGAVFLIHGASAGWYIVG
jgi:hypothetical protein